MIATSSPTAPVDRTARQADQPANDNRHGIEPLADAPSEVGAQPESPEWRVISILAAYSRIKDVETRRRLVDLLQAMEG